MITESGPYGGAQRNTFLTMKGLIEDGYDAELICGPGGPLIQRGEGGRRSGLRDGGSGSPGASSQRLPRPCSNCIGYSDPGAITSSTPIRSRRDCLAGWLLGARGFL